MNAYQTLFCEMLATYDDISNDELIWHNFLKPICDKLSERSAENDEQDAKYRESTIKLVEYCVSQIRTHYAARNSIYH